MADNQWIVVKVGGSLFDLPGLRDRLRAFLAELGDGPILLVPGGGAAADAVRLLDRVHHLGEEASHWLAIQALSINARFLHTLLPEANLVGSQNDWEQMTCIAPASFTHTPTPTQAQQPTTNWRILDPAPFFQEDERRPDHCPHVWQVTSDSLSLRAAALFGARELVLLKSVSWTGDDWIAAGGAGIVDAWFATALSRWPMAVRVVNFRA